MKCLPNTHINNLIYVNVFLFDLVLDYEKNIDSNNIIRRIALLDSLYTLPTRLLTFEDTMLRNSNCSSSLFNSPLDLDLWNLQ